MNHIKSTTGKYEYCPNGNYWKDVSGVFDDKIYLYCGCKHCGGKMYQLRPVDVTKKIPKETIGRIKKQEKLADIKREINFTNMDKVKELLTSEEE